MRPLCSFVLPALLAACSNLSVPAADGIVTPYRIDVRQGNYVTQEMVAQLKPGMTREQVRFILGTPLVTDIFHADRWDYVYSFKPGRGERQLRRFAVFFEDDRLVRVAGDVVGAEPGEAEASAAAAAEARARVIEIAPAQPKDGPAAKLGGQGEGEAAPAAKP